MQRVAQYHRDVSQLRPLAPYLSTYTQYAPQFHDWLKTQQPAGAPPKGENEPWWKEMWNPPEYDHSWESYIQVGADGKKGFAPETPPEVIAKYQSYRQFRTQQAEKMLQNPFQFFEGAIDRRAKTIAESIVKEHLGHLQQKQSASEYIQQNKSWLYDLGPDGNPKVGQTLNPMTGQYIQTPILSQWGQKFYQYAQQRAEWQQSRGVQDEEDMKQWAQTAVERDYAIALYQSGRAQAAPGGAPASPSLSPQQAANQAFLSNNNPPAAMPRSNGNQRVATPKVDDKNLRQTMLDRLKAIE